MVSRAEEQRRVNYHYMADAMRMLEWDLHQRLMSDLRIPDEWHEIARDKGQRGKTRVTIRLDEDIVKFFRSMGPDWQPRLNRVLSVWMHARLAGMIRGAETMDYMKLRKDEGHDGPRPRWGELSRMEEDAFGPEAFEGMEDEGVPMGTERVASKVLKAELDARLAGRE